LQTHHRSLDPLHSLIYGNREWTGRALSRGDNDAANFTPTSLTESPRLS
jgi:hypothetical protein